MRMGEALSQRGYRENVFLMTKIDGGGKEEATRYGETRPGKQDLKHQHGHRHRGSE
jgi:hypothetical protein